MKKRNKIRLFLTLILCVIFLSYCSSIAHGHINTRSTGSVSHSSERYGMCNSVEETTDPQSYKFMDHYSTHDWVADSAIRLILNSDNPEYKKYVEWLFRYSDEINYKDFDNKFGWWRGDSGWSFTDEELERIQAYIYFLYGTKIPDFNSRLSVAVEDVKGRNTIGWGNIKQFHHIYYEYDKKIEDYRTEDSAAMGQANLAANDAFEFLTGQQSDPSDGQPKYRAAAACLGGISHFITDLAHPAHVMTTDGTHQWKNGREYSGKTHDSHGFVDRYASIAGSTVMKPNTYIEKIWTAHDVRWQDINYYNDNEYGNPDNTGAAEWAGEERWPSSKKDNPFFPMGGPDWSVIDIRDLKIPPNNDRLATDETNFVVSGLTPMPAPVAAYKMGKLTVSGWDEPNGADSKVPDWGCYKKECGPNSAYRLPTLSYGCDYVFISTKFSNTPCTDYSDSCDNTKDRVKVLLKWAAYYSACAILDVCKRAWKKNNGQWPEEQVVPTIGYREMLTMEQVITIWNQEHQADKVLLPQSQAAKTGKAVASVGAMTMLIVPLLSISMLVAIVPPLAKKQQEI